MKKWDVACAAAWLGRVPGVPSEVPPEEREDAGLPERAAWHEVSETQA